MHKQRNGKSIDLHGRDAFAPHDDNATGLLDARAQQLVRGDVRIACPVDGVIQHVVVLLAQRVQDHSVQLVVLLANHRLVILFRHGHVEGQFRHRLRDEIVVVLRGGSGGGLAWNGALVFWHGCFW